MVPAGCNTGNRPDALLTYDGAANWLTNNRFLYFGIERTMLLYNVITNYLYIFNLASHTELFRSTYIVREVSHNLAIKYGGPISYTNKSIQDIKDFIPIIPLR